MITQQLRTNNVLDNSILDLYTRIDRAAFVRPESKAFAYSDLQLPLSHDQKMMTPLEEALIVQALQLQGHETVLEIGTGSGFLTALLSLTCKQVLSIDCFPEFTARAQKNCSAFGLNNIEFVTGDGCQGWVTRAPYDVVVFTGGLLSLSETHKLQVLLGGKLFAIVGESPIMAGRLYAVDHHNHWQDQLIFETDIPLLIDKQRHQPFVF